MKVYVVIEQFNYSNSGRFAIHDIFDSRDGATKQSEMLNKQAKSIKDPITYAIREFELKQNNG